MYISRISIKNFRNFGGSPFEMKLRPFTLILGENNVGKTNLLAALALVYNQEISALQKRTLELDDFNYDIVTAFKKQVADDTVSPDDVNFPEILIDTTISDITDDQHPVLGDWYSNTELSEARITYRFSLRGNFNRQKWVVEQREAVAASDKAMAEHSRYIGLPIGDYRHSIYGGGRPDNDCDAWLLRMLRVEILDALRDAERELTAGGDQRLLFRVLRQGSDVGYTDIKRLLDELRAAIDDEPALASIKSDVQKLLSRVSLVTPGEDHSIGLHFAALEAVEILKKLAMTYGANPITVERNGLGRNNLLYVALVLSQLAKAPDLTAGDDNYVAFRLVGIEEPEAHLHPHLQDHLAQNVEDVRKDHADSLQLILTSHSTHVAAKLSLDNTVVLFRKDNDGTLAAHYLLDGIDRVKNKGTVRFLTLYLDATKSRMFFARRLILVEGIAEQIVLPRLFEQATGQTLESIGCTVVNVNGVAFRHFLTIIKNGFFKKCVVITDSDAGTKTENRAKNLREDFKDHSHIDIQVTKERTFEEELIAANATGDPARLLFEALTMTKPDNGPALEKKTGANAIDIETFFAEIEHYKAEFAINLVSLLSQSATNELRKAATTKKKAKKKATKKGATTTRVLNVPTYLANAFEFVRG